MIKYYLIFTLFICHFSFSQSINDLDTKNGFRNFKLGSSQEEISNIVKVKSEYSKNQEISQYEFIGKEMNGIYDVNIESIVLLFYKNKLYRIIIRFGNEIYSFNDREYEIITSYIEKTYGKHNYKLTSKRDNFVKGLKWEGKKVILDLSQFILKEHYVGGISITDIQLEKEMYKSEF